MIEKNIYEILSGSTEISNIINNNIYNHHLPDNFDLEKPAIVFIINKEEGIHSLDNKNELERYTLEIIGIDNDTVELDNLISIVETVIQEFENDNIRDCTSVSITPTMDAEKGQYIKRITFNIIYSK